MARHSVLLLSILLLVVAELGGTGMDQQETDALYEMADQYYREGKYRKALAVLHRLDTTNPNTVAILYSKALCLVQLSRVWEARQIFDKIEHRCTEEQSEWLSAVIEAESECLDSTWMDGENSRSEIVSAGVDALSSGDLPIDLYEAQDESITQMLEDLQEAEANANPPVVSAPPFPHWLMYVIVSCVYLALLLEFGSRGDSYRRLFGFWVFVFPSYYADMLTFWWNGGFGGPITLACLWVGLTALRIFGGKSTTEFVLKSWFIPLAPFLFLGTCSNSALVNAGEIGWLGEDTHTESRIVHKRTWDWVEVKQVWEGHEEVNNTEYRIFFEGLCGEQWDLPGLSNFEGCSMEVSRRDYEQFKIGETILLVEAHPRSRHMYAFANGVLAEFWESLYGTIFWAVSCVVYVVLVANRNLRLRLLKSIRA